MNVVPHSVVEVALLTKLMMITQINSMQLVQEKFNTLVLVLGAVLTILYLWSAPPEITFEDTAIFTSACATFGLPQPSGYPLYIWTCVLPANLANLLGFSYALGATFVSAVCAAVACMLVALLLNRLTKAPGTSLFVATLLGLCSGVWTQAQIPEVYTLNLLLAVASWYCCQRIVEEQNKKWLTYLALFVGLGLSNHWPLFVLTGLTLVIWLGTTWKIIFTWIKDIKFFGRCVGFLVLGLVPYLHFFIVSNDAYIFAPDYTSKDFFNYISRHNYGQIKEEFTFAEKISSALVATTWIGHQYFVIGGLVILLGLVSLLKKPQTRSTTSRRMGHVIVYVCTCIDSTV